MLAAHSGSACENMEEGEQDWQGICQTLTASNKKLIASQTTLERDLADIQRERELAGSDLEKLNAENAALDTLLQQLEAKRNHMRRRLVELYRTNLKLRQKLARRPK